MSSLQAMLLFLKHLMHANHAREQFLLVFHFTISLPVCAVVGPGLHHCATSARCDSTSVPQYFSASPIHVCVCRHGAGDISSQSSRGWAEPSVELLLHVTPCNAMQEEPRTLSMQQAGKQPTGAMSKAVCMSPHTIGGVDADAPTPCKKK